MKPRNYKLQKIAILLFLFICGYFCGWLHNNNKHAKSLRSEKADDWLRYNLFATFYSILNTPDLKPAVRMHFASECVISLFNYYISRASTADERTDPSFNADWETSLVVDKLAPMLPKEYLADPLGIHNSFDSNSPDIAASLSGIDGFNFHKSEKEYNSAVARFTRWLGQSGSEITAMPQK